MTLDAVIAALVDRCIQLVKARKDWRRETFSELVEPVWINFEAIHAHYIECLRRYRGLIEDTDHAPDLRHPVFDALRTDHIYSQSTRDLEKVLSEAVLPERHRFSDDQIVSMVSGISFYLCGNVGWANTGTEYWASNITRANLHEGLQVLFGTTTQLEGLVRISGEYKFCSTSSGFDLAELRVRARLAAEDTVGINYSFTVPGGILAETLKRDLEHSGADTATQRRLLGRALVDVAAAENSSLHTEIASAYQKVRKALLL